MKDREVYHYFYVAIQKKELMKFFTNQVQTLAKNLVKYDCAEFIEGCSTGLKLLTENTRQHYRNHSRFTRIFHDSPADKIKEANYLVDSITDINDMSVVINLLFNFRQQKAIHGSSFESFINNYLIENSGIEIKYSSDSKEFVFANDANEVRIGTDYFWQQLDKNIKSLKKAEATLAS